MDTSLGFLLLLLFGLTVFAIYRYAMQTINAINNRTYSVVIRTSLASSNASWEFLKILHLKLPPVEGQKITDGSGWFKVTSVHPRLAGDDYCGELSCEMVTGDGFDPVVYINSLLKHDWELDKLVSDPLPDNVNESI